MEGEGWGEGDWGGGEEGGGEGWETVTEEGEEWARLQLRLEVLTCLCGVVGMAVVSRAPPLPLLRTTRKSGETQDEGEETQAPREGEYCPSTVPKRLVNYTYALILIYLLKFSFPFTLKPCEKNFLLYKVLVNALKCFSMCVLSLLTFFPPGCISVALLEAVGPWLIANTVGYWLVSQRVSPHTISSLPSPPTPSHTTATATGELVNPHTNE